MTIFNYTSSPEVKISQKVLGGLLFLTHTVHHLDCPFYLLLTVYWHHNQNCSVQIHAEEFICYQLSWIKMYYCCVCVRSVASSPICRICYEADLREELLQPCSCRGSMAHAHRSCLELWMNTTHRDICQICRFRFPTSRRPATFREVGGVGYTETPLLWRDENMFTSAKEVTFYQIY